MLENIFDLRYSSALTHHLRVLERVDLCLQTCIFSRHVIEDAIKKDPPDHCGFLDHALGLLRKSIQTGKQDSLERVRHLDRLDELCNPPPDILAHQHPALY